MSQVGVSFSKSGNWVLVWLSSKELTGETGDEIDLLYVFLSSAMITVWRTQLCNILLLQISFSGACVTTIENQSGYEPRRGGERGWQKQKF